MDMIRAMGLYAEAYLGDRFRVDMRDDTGALSLQWAAVAAFMIFIAVAVAAVMMNKAQNQANNIPDTVTTP